MLLLQRESLFEFIWCHIFTIRNGQATKSQRVKHLWSNYNPLVSTLKWSFNVCSNPMGLFKNKTGRIVLLVLILEYPGL